MRIELVFFLLFPLSLICISTIHGQAPTDPSPVVINEIGLMPDSEQRYIELLVIGADNDPTAPVDLSGWMIDNYSEGLASEDGFLRLSAAFSNLLPGTLILIYDPLYPHTQINHHMSGYLADQQLIQYPIDDPALEKLKKSAYDNGQIVTAKSFTWTAIFPFSNNNDGLFLLDPYNNTRKGVSWIEPLVPQSSFPIIDPVLPSVQPWTPVVIADGPCRRDRPMVTSTKATPGKPNDVQNEILINALLNQSSSALTIAIQCSQKYPDNGDPNLGAGQIIIDGGTGPFEINWSGPGTDATFPSSQSVISINPIPGGTYYVIVSDINGCSARCDFVINELASTAEVCEGDCQEIGRDLTPEECGFNWSPKIGLLDPEGSQTVACPLETMNYRLTTSDINGNIVASEEYIVKVNEVGEVNITPDPAILCGADIELTVTGEWESYNWSIPFPTTDITNQAMVMAREDDMNEWSELEPVYEVVVTDENGCTAQDDVYVGTSYDFNGILASFDNAKFLKYNVEIVSAPLKRVIKKKVGDDLIIVDGTGTELNLTNLFSEKYGRLNSIGLNAEIFITRNDILCNEEFLAVQSEFDNSNAFYKIWYHLIEDPNNNPTEDILLVKLIFGEIENDMLDFTPDMQNSACTVSENGILFLDGKRAIEMLDNAIAKLDSYDGESPLLVKTALGNNFAGEFDYFLAQDIKRIYIRLKTAIFLF